MCTPRLTGSIMGFGPGTRIAQSLHAVGNVCYAEGLSATDVQSILFLDDEIEVVIGRTAAAATTYPFALFDCREQTAGPPL